ncbi:MAG: TadE/TadG family type IV pilus assembly protein [Parasphingorhabdus sp.]
MTIFQNLKRKLSRDERGMAVTEFGIILVPFSILLMGAFDLGYQNYLRSVLQGTLTEAARQASTENPIFSGTGATLQDRIQDSIEKRVQDLYPDVDFEGDPNNPDDDAVKIRNYYEFSGVGKPEKLTYDANGNGEFDFDDGDCWQDLNDNGSFDQDAGRDGLGGSSDIIFYEISVSIPRIFPMAALIGASENYTVTANTAVRTQPFETQQAPQNVCAEP